jgi:hypothetical protein
VLTLDVAGDVDVGFDDAAMLPEPEPHIPVNPDVASVPEVIVTPEVADMADDVDIPGDIDALPGVAAVAGVVVAAATPPPSYVVGDPNVPSGEVVTVEHAAPLLAFGTVIVPVSPLGTVLPPGDAPGAKPFGPIDTPGKPSEEVVPSGGMAVVMPACAKAGLWHSKDQAPQAANTEAEAMAFPFMRGFLFIVTAHRGKIVSSLSPGPSFP